METSDIYNIQNRYNNHIKPVIGSLPILKVSRQDLKRVILTAHTKHNLSEKTLKNIRGDLSGFCNYLDDADIRHDLRTYGIKIPKGAKKSVKNILSAECIYVVFTNDKTTMRRKEVKDDLVYAYRFQVLYGLRPGELMGLEWGDISGDYIFVQRSINAHNNTTAGKNEYAPRWLPLTPTAKMLLDCQRQYRCNPNNAHERIFGDYQEITYCARWKRYCQHNNIPYITPYELRHTFASINKKIPTWMLDELMGHAHAGVSLGIYAHPMDGDMDDAAELLENNLTRQLAYARHAHNAKPEGGIDM